MLLCMAFHHKMNKMAELSMAADAQNSVLAWLQTAPSGSGENGIIKHATRTSADRTGLQGIQKRASRLAKECS